MKNAFKGFYNPTKNEIEEAWNDESSLFIFDTNVFLNLYGFAEQTRCDFFNVLDSLQEKLWIPYHVGLEYQYKRLPIIKNEKAIFIDLRKAIEKIDKIFEDDIKKLSLQKRYPKLNESVEKLSKETAKLVAIFKKTVDRWDDKQPCVRSHDPIRAKIDEIFSGKVGSPPIDQDYLNKVYEEGQTRYQDKIPPGYKDIEKSKHDEPFFFYDSLKYERQYGDLIIWKQIVEKTKEDTIRKVFFITDDSKEDWWYILDSRGTKQIGPHANLQCELFKNTNIIFFHMYNTSTFLEDGKKYLKIGIRESSIEDAKNSEAYSSVHGLPSNENLNYRNHLGNIFGNKGLIDAIIRHSNSQIETVDFENPIIKLKNLIEKPKPDLASRVNHIINIYTKQIEKLNISEEEKNELIYNFSFDLFTELKDRN